VRVWLCEKKDQAENLAPLLGNPRRGAGFIDTNDGRVTWAIGHLLQQASPEGYNPEWEKWTLDTLPMIPDTWRLLPDENKKRQLDAVLATLAEASEVVVATDCGQEGEAIARELLDHAGYAGAVRRLWYSALDEASLRKALGAIRDGSSSEPMYWAAQARARADWLIGMNLTRAYTLRSRATGAKGVRSVGRVQTPTLALVVRRDREIEAFQVRTFYDIEAQASTATGEAVTLRHSPPEAERLYDREAAEALARRVSGHQGPLRVEQNERTQAPPKLLNLTRLTSLTSKKLGWKADHTLKIAQSLYDKKLTTYPRTACVHLPNEQEPEVGDVLDALGKVPALARSVAALSVHKPVIRKSVFNTEQVNKHEHHAIVPRPGDPSAAQLDDDEKAAYALIAQHYLAALMPDYRFAETRFTLDADGVALTAVGRVPLDQGWRAVFGAADPEAEDDAGEDQAGELPAIADGARVTLDTAALKPRKTTPPKRYTDGTLQQDMESVAKFATDPRIKERLKETSGIGTVATRAEVIKTLRERGYIEDQGKHIVSTATGRELIDVLPTQLTDPAMTAVWEERLDELRRGALGIEHRDEFVQKIAGNITRLIASIVGEAAELAANRAPSEAQVRYANTIAQALGVAAPAEGAPFAQVQGFIDQHADAFASLPPSPAQLAFAEKVAGEKGIELPADVRTNRSACGAWLDVNAPKSKPKGKAAGKKAATKRRTKA
jgi:DNA topoisomerase-3